MATRRRPPEPFVAPRPSRRRARLRSERAFFVGVGVLILVLAIVNAGVGGSVRFPLVVVAVAGTAGLWWLTRRSPDDRRQE
ncbi:MAG TPA: hypothetical protein VFI28_01230 [Candidatus Limnocylindrales bacterium]|nr:hypothetical protein [Candidatus Limnocylindrales bacterium]